MQKYTIVLTIFLALTLCVSIAYASTVYTWDYTKFNSETPDYRELDKATTSISFEIINKLTFNSTTTGAKAVVQICNGTTGTIYHVDIVFVKDGTLEVVLNMPSYIKIATGTWEENITTRVSIDSDGDLYVKHGDTVIVDDYNIGTFTMRAFGGSGVAHSCTSGYLSVDLGAYETNQIVNEWLPAILSIAMLGIAIGMIKKYI